MAKVLFIQKEASEKFGVMTLSAVLKKAGHGVDIFIELLEKETVFEFVQHFQPDFIAFSITTIERDWAINLASKIKKRYKVFSVFGGAEPTYDPGIISEPVVDFICRGEGEDAILELLDRLREGKNIVGVNNIWGKDGKKLIENPLRPLKTDLNTLPIPDREIYYKYPLLKNLSTKKFLCSRGCPYNCTFCSNHAYLKLFQGLGRFIRFRNPRVIIEEIKEIRIKYRFKTVYFADETFTLNHPWLHELLDLYRKEIKIPFSCLARVNELDEKTIRLLKQSGCFCIAFGIESGSERIRNGILKKNLSEESLLKVGKLLKKYKMPFLAHHMYVLPTETLKDALKTVELNIQMGTDGVWDTVFQPFKNTEIYEYCKKMKLLPKKVQVDSMFGQSKIKNPDKKKIENLRKLAWLTIRLPWLLPITKKLILLPNNPVFELILKISQVYSIRMRWRLSFFEMLRLAWGTGNKLG